MQQTLTNIYINYISHNISSGECWRGEHQSNLPNSQNDSPTLFWHKYFISQKPTSCILFSQLSVCITRIFIFTAKIFFYVTIWQTALVLPLGKFVNKNGSTMTITYNWQILNDKAILMHNEQGYSVSGMFTLEHRIQTCLDLAHYSAHIKLIHFIDTNVNALELCEHFCNGVMHRLSNKLMFHTFIRCNFTPVWSNY